MVSFLGRCSLTQHGLQFLVVQGNTCSKLRPQTITSLLRQLVSFPARSYSTTPLTFIRAGHLMAGAVAGAASRSATAPLETLRLAAMAGRSLGRLGSTLATYTTT